MAFDPVPFAVGGGAEHSAEVFRTMAYTATGGAEGVAESGDLKVQSLATPGSQVRVMPGAAIIRSRATGGAQQSYVARNVTSTNVSVASTGSGAGRSDLVAILIKDPFMAGEPWPTPSDPAVGPYVEAVIISNVSSSTKTLQSVSGYANTTGYAVARIDIPASTSTITNAMITDLRTLASPRSSSMALSAASTGAGKVSGSYVSPNPMSSATFVLWPTAATWQVSVPAWATRAVVTAQVFGAATRVGDVWGQTRITFGGLAGTYSSYDVNADANPARVTLGTAHTFAVTSGMRGTTQTVRHEGLKSGGAGHLTAQDGVTTIMSIHFEEGVI